MRRGAIPCWPRRKNGSIAIRVTHLPPCLRILKVRRRRTGKQTGNISIYWFDGGWVWMIPLPDDVMSVGTVCSADYFKQRTSSPDEYFIETLKRCAGAWERSPGCRAAHAGAGDGQLLVSVAVTIPGKGFALIGDAFAFIDPVFSSGVYLAMSSAQDIVDVAERWLERGRGPVTREIRKKL